MWKEALSLSVSKLRTMPELLKFSQQVHISIAFLEVYSTL